MKKNGPRGGVPNIPVGSVDAFFRFQNSSKGKKLPVPTGGIVESTSSVEGATRFLRSFFTDGALVVAGRVFFRNGGVIDVVSIRGFLRCLELEHFFFFCDCEAQPEALVVSGDSGANVFFVEGADVVISV